LWLFEHGSNDIGDADTYNEAIDAEEARNKVEEQRKKEQSKKKEVEGCEWRTNKGKKTTMKQKQVCMEASYVLDASKVPADITKDIYGSTKDNSKKSANEVGIMWDQYVEGLGGVGEIPWDELKAAFPGEEEEEELPQAEGVGGGAAGGSGEGGGAAGGGAQGIVGGLDGAEAAGGAEEAMDEVDAAGEVGGSRKREREDGRDGARAEETLEEEDESMPSDEDEDEEDEDEHDDDQEPPPQKRSRRLMGAPCLKVTDLPQSLVGRGLPIAHRDRNKSSFYGCKCGWKCGMKNSESSLSSYFYSKWV
jgi:hypothetical protein